jgi:hypothetical protein
MPKMTPEQYRAAMSHCGWYVTVGRRGGQCMEPLGHDGGHRLPTADPGDAIEVPGFGHLNVADSE